MGHLSPLKIFTLKMGKPCTEIFQDQNQGSSIWGSRDIKRFRS